MATSCERKTLFNILRLKVKEGEEENVESWQVEDYRKWSLKMLFKALEELELPLDSQSFLAYVDASENVEGLLELLFAGSEEIDQETYDRAFLVCFELWRRLSPNVISLEMLCDELDYQMESYENEADNDEKVQDALSMLVSLSEEEESSSSEAFQAVCEGCAGDLELFIYEYTSDQIEAEASSYAQELIENFLPMTSNPRWLEFLSLRLIDEEEVKKGFLKLYQSLLEEMDPQLLIEVVLYLSDSDLDGLFLKFFKAIPFQYLDREDLTDLKEALEVYEENYGVSEKWKKELSSLGFSFS